MEKVRNWFFFLFQRDNYKRCMGTFRSSQGWLYSHMRWHCAGSSIFDDIWIFNALKKFYIFNYEYLNLTLLLLASYSYDRCTHYWWKGEEDGSFFVTHFFNFYFSYLCFLFYFNNHFKLFYNNFLFFILNSIIRTS